MVEPSDTDYEGWLARHIGSLETRIDQLEQRSEVARHTAWTLASQLTSPSLHAALGGTLPSAEGYEDWMLDRIKRVADHIEVELTRPAAPPPSPPEL